MRSIHHYRDKTEKSTYDKRFFRYHKCFLRLLPKMMPGATGLPARAQKGGAERNGCGDRQIPKNRLPLAYAGGDAGRGEPHKKGGCHAQDAAADPGAIRICSAAGRAGKDSGQERQDLAQRTIGLRVLLAAGNGSKHQRQEEKNGYEEQKPPKNRPEERRLCLPAAGETVLCPFQQSIHK